MIFSNLELHSKNAFSHCRSAPESLSTHHEGQAHKLYYYHNVDRPKVALQEIKQLLLQTFDQTKLAGLTIFLPRLDQRTSEEKGIIMTTLIDLKQDAQKLIPGFNLNLVAFETKEGALELPADLTGLFDFDYKLCPSNNV